MRILGGVLEKKVRFLFLWWLLDWSMAKREVFEIFGLIGVIGSLIFVGVEVRQNTAEIRGSTHQSVSEQVNELYLTIAEDERL